VTHNPVRVFVHLAYGFGAENWHRRWLEGKIIGINEPFPYGYYQATRHGCLIEHSQDTRETWAKKLVRLGFRAVLGFDLVHAWRNFDGIRNADVVWTHTESQYLAVIFLLQSTPPVRRPKLIAQSIWLFDRWNRFSTLRQLMFSKLIKQADILTVHSPENLAIARRLFPNVRSELVLFGIAATNKIAPMVRPNPKPLHIASLGNDEHRDWGLLIDAVRNKRDWELRIASHNIDLSSINNVSNVTIVKPKNNDDLFSFYRWADVVVLAMKPNFHASGITVIQEASLQGIPVICTDTGGLRAYFSANEVRFVPPQDVAALREAISSLADDQSARLALAQNAQARMGPTDLSSESFARRHAEISSGLLDRC
jgi:glycosyltransferase involved in cell wall biosynthesis